MSNLNKHHEHDEVWRPDLPGGDTVDSLPAQTCGAQQETEINNQEPDVFQDTKDPAPDEALSARDIARALRQNFRDTGVIDDVTVGPDSLKFKYP